MSNVKDPWAIPAIPKKHKRFVAKNLAQADMDRIGRVFVPHTRHTMVPVGKVLHPSQIDKAIKADYLKALDGRVYIYIGHNEKESLPTSSQTNLQPDFSGFDDKSNDNLFTFLAQSLYKTQTDDRNFSLFGVCTDDSGTTHWGGGSHLFHSTDSRKYTNSPSNISSPVSQATSYLAGLHTQFNAEAALIKKINAVKTYNQLDYRCFSPILIQRFFQGRAPNMKTTHLFSMNFGYCVVSSDKVPRLPGMSRQAQNSMKLLSEIHRCSSHRKISGTRNSVSRRLFPSRTDFKNSALENLSQVSQ
jgi:hypothetical protein